MSFIYSIKFRFTVWYLLVLIVLIGALSVGVYFYLSRSLHENLDNSLEVRASELRGIRGVLNTIAMGEFQEELGEVVILYYKYGDELRTISARNVDVNLDVAVVQRALNGEEMYTTIKAEDNGGLRFYVVPFHHEGPILLPGRPGVSPNEFSFVSAALAVGRSTEDIDAALTGLMRTLLIAVPLTLALAGGGGVFLARRALKPVEEITHTAHEIEESDLSKRIPVQSKDELGRLASILNQMIERLEKAFKRQQQFTSDASHELRTPLAVIKAESTLSLEKDRAASDYKRSLEVVSQESEHMSRVIDQLLILARADSGTEQLTFDKISLTKLVANIGTEAEKLCMSNGLKFKLESVDNLLVNGDRTRLKELFANLIDNAVRYTTSGGSVTISLRREGDMAVVAVTDTGIGISDKDIPLIFERFYRVDKARSRDAGGAGLGLAICKYIAEVHGGRIDVESQVGRGSTFSVWLPISN